MMRFPWRRLWSVLALILAASGARGAYAPPPAGAAPGYVGSAACQACHEEQFRSWTGSHHDLAMQPATESAVLGDFNDQVFEHRGVRTRFYRDDGRFMVETQGADGGQHSYEVAYTFGVTPLQQYLIGFPDGRYQALTVAWDARPKESGGQRWFALYPDEDTPPGDELHWLAPAHNWNFACAECHSTNLHKGYDAAQDSYATTWSEIDVGCEACHGPASTHVALAEAARAGDKAAYPADHGLVVQLKEGADWQLVDGSNTAVRTSETPGAAQVEVCGRCHSRRTQISEDYDTARRCPTPIVWQLLDDGLYFPDGQILDEVYVYGSFRQSRMHAAGVTCSDCHEPHSLKLRGEGNAVCTGCHGRRTTMPVPIIIRTGTAGSASPATCRRATTWWSTRGATTASVFRGRIWPLNSVCPTSAADVTRAATRLGRGAGPKPGMARIVGAGSRLMARRWPPRVRRRPMHLHVWWRLATEVTAPAMARATALDALGAYLGRRRPFRRWWTGSMRRMHWSAAPRWRPWPGSSQGTRWTLLSPLLDDPVRGVRIALAGVLADIRVSSLDEADRPRLQRVFDDYLASERLNADRAEHWVNLAGFHARQGQRQKRKRPLLRP